MLDSSKIRTITWSQASVGAKALISLSNLYAAEEMPDGVVRWTGPGSVFSLYLPVDRQHEWLVSLVCIRSISPFNWDNVFADYEGDMVLCDHRQVDDRHHLSCKIAAVPSMTGVIMRFHLQETRRMRAPLYGKADQRSLGLCIEKVELRRL